MQTISFIKCAFDRIDNLFCSLENKIDHCPLFIRSLFVGFGAWAISIFFYMQQYFSFDNLDKSGRAVDFIKLCSNPLARDLVEPILAYRITTPTIAWLLGLHSSFALILPSVAMIILLSMIYVICYRKVGKNTAILTTLGISFTQVTLWNNAHTGVPDAVTHLAAVLCLLFTNIWGISFLVILGIMNDERFLLAMPFILLWNINISNKVLDFRPIIKVSTGLLFGLLVSLFFRQALTVGWIGDGIAMPGVYQEIWVIFLNSIQFIWNHKFWFVVNYFMSFRWLWIIPLTCLFISSNGARSYFIFFWILMLAVIFASSLVWDVSRSIAFSFPAILICVRYLNEYNASLCRNLLIASILLCLATPAFFLGPGGLQIYLPLPFILLKYFTGFDIVDLVRTRGHGTFGFH